MRVNYCSHVALLVSLALVNIGCKVLPSEGDRHARRLTGRSEESIYQDIVRDSEPLKKLKPDLVMFAFSSKFENSNFYWDKYYDARDDFWHNLRKKDDGDKEFHGVLEIIAKGDENQVRKLLADGTIFCKNDKNGYNPPLKSITWNPNHHSEHESTWREVIDEKKQNVVPLMNALSKRELHKQRVSNPKEFLSPTHKDTVTNECYDVSLRDGQDVMLKWAIANGKKDETDKILSTYHKPMRRFNNLIMGSLYLAYLMEFDDKMEEIADKLNCTEVNSNMRDSCYTLYNYATKQPATGELSRMKTDIPDYFYTSKPSDDKGEVKKFFNSYNRNKIKPSEFLEVY
ncbi:hypothetical protein IWQ62_006166 [Dispira parvispora]|uniref:Uncharacterized protein n=1 Tax=Dispira parvispora TaxID=1520584 RepID=A0A9W8E4K3_9FUNG|nr:hypothetical protein IWQ62_006166 [Dispira parvispora]